jgi:hypothetical protein
VSEGVDIALQAGSKDPGVVTDVITFGSLTLGWITVAITDHNVESDQSPML